tara:strand:+ start:75 stop:281 length:207 start_codon:yes stop_codon:yes gene_type:complete
MSSSSTKHSKVDSDVVLSLKDHRNIVNEDSSSRNEYSKVGYLYPERNTPQLRWFKGSSNRGLREEFAA